MNADWSVQKETEKVRKGKVFQGGRVGRTRLERNGYEHSPDSDSDVGTQSSLRPAGRGLAQTKALQIEVPVS